MSGQVKATKLKMKFFSQEFHKFLEVSIFRERTGKFSNKNEPCTYIFLSSYFFLPSNCRKLIQFMFTKFIYTTIIF